MASWMIHLRVAGRVLPDFPDCEYINESDLDDFIRCAAEEVVKTMGELEGGI